MQVTVDKDKLLRLLAAREDLPVRRGGCRTGLPALDEAAPGGVFQSGAVHELLWQARGISPKSFALLLAKSAQNIGDGIGGAPGGAIVWSDPLREINPPVLAAGGIDPRNLVLLRCPKRSDELWALAQCLRCRAVSATVAAIRNLSRVEARRLQLAAEAGGGIGIFIRPFAAAIDTPYAAATRWLVQSAPGDSDVQRWSIQLLHGHGGQIGKIILLEVDRETRALHISPPMAHRPAAPAPQRASA
jgi:protein ImuA